VAAATAEKPKAETADIVSVLGVETVLLSELRKKVNDLDIARAWSGGFIEFGRRKHCVTGQAIPGRPQHESSRLVLEGAADDIEWSGPKSKLHAEYVKIRDEKPPACFRGRRYDEFKPENWKMGEELSRKAVDIDIIEAQAAIALVVRLTDKGLGTTS
jgi:hypothetical protein